MPAIPGRQEISLESDRCHQLFQLRDLADIGRLVDQAAHMNREPATIHIIRLFTEQVE